MHNDRTTNLEAPDIPAPCIDASYVEDSPFNDQGAIPPVSMPPNPFQTASSASETAISRPSEPEKGRGQPEDEFAVEIPKTLTHTRRHKGKLFIAGEGKVPAEIMFLATSVTEEEAAETVSGFYGAEVKQRAKYGLHFEGRLCQLRNRHREQPCEVCRLFPDDYICPECHVCGEQGNPECYEKHGLVRSEMQIASLAEQQARWTERVTAPWNV